MFAHPDRDRRQLGQLTPRRLPSINEFALTELVRTGLATIRPVLDDLVDQLIQSKQQTDRRLPITIQDPLRLSPLHTTKFATQTRVPTPAERLPKTTL